MGDSIIISLAKLSDQLQKDNKLESLVYQFREKYNLSPCFGVEIEFYASNNLDIKKLSRLVQIPIKLERGSRQFEIDLPPSIDLTLYANQINQLREKLKVAALNLNEEVDFTSKPSASDFGSSMHFHLNFIGLEAVIASEQQRAWRSRNGSQRLIDLSLDCFASARNDEHNNWLLDLAASSLCHYMLDTFLAFMPSENDYARIDHNFMAPVNVSYGNNNRTTAIRVPDSLPKRLEHRVSSSMVDPYLVMVTILQSVLLGLENPKRVKVAPKIYGNAFDEQYGLVRFPRSLSEALVLFKEEFYF